MKQANLKRHRYRNTALLIVIAASCIGAFLMGTEAIRSIRSNVRSTTVQVIREITNSKSQMLTAILNDTERDLRGLAASLDASMDIPSATALLERFENDHTVSGLTVIDRGGQALYGPENAHLLKGIPKEFAAKVAVGGFEMSDPLIDENGGRRVLFGTALTGDRILYASVPTASMQKACGETTYLGEGYSYILGRDGKIVIPPVRYNYEQVYEDIGHLLIYADNPSGRVGEFIEALNSGSTGSACHGCAVARGGEGRSPDRFHGHGDGNGDYRRCGRGVDGRFLFLLVHAAQAAGK